MERIIINHCATCDPIMNLLEFLIEKRRYTIQEKYCRDPHFNEMYFKLQGGDNFDDIPKIKNIKQYLPAKFNCECHWSIVEVG